MNMRRRAAVLLPTGVLLLVLAAVAALYPPLFNPMMLTMPVALMAGLFTLLVLEIRAGQR